MTEHPTMLDQRDGPRDECGVFGLYAPGHDVARYAYFALSALYDLPKPSLNMYNVLFSNTPFGANISLDGVHPSAQGQGILASAAAQSINARYGLTIP